MEFTALDSKARGESLAIDLPVIDDVLGSYLDRRIAEFYDDVWRRTWKVSVDGLWGLDAGGLCGSCSIAGQLSRVQAIQDGRQEAIGSVVDGLKQRAGSGEADRVGRVG